MAISNIYEGPDETRGIGFCDWEGLWLVEFAWTEWGDSSCEAGKDEISAGEGWGLQPLKREIDVKHKFYELCKYQQHSRSLNRNKGEKYDMTTY